MSVFPIPDLVADPGTWPELVLYAATVFLEAEGEPDEGKVAVAYVIRNRMQERRQSIRQVILGKDERALGDGKAFEQFSCWNDDYVAQWTTRLAGAEGELYAQSWRAACGALWKLFVDPTRGATFYLNPTLTRQIRGGTLPSWYDPMKVHAKIGRHEFLVA